MNAKKSLATLGAIALAWSATAGDGVECAGSAIRGKIDFDAVLLDIEVRGSLAFAAADNRGLAVIDFSDRSAPNLISLFDLGGRVRAVESRDELAFCVLDTGFLVSIDISEPAAPAVVGQVSLPAGAEDLALSWPVAYVAGGEAGLVTVDLTIPTAPAVVAVNNTPGTASGVAVAGDTVLLADGDHGLFIFDATTRHQPSQVRQYFGVRPHKVSAQGDLAAASAGDTVILDIADRASPIIVASHPARSTARRTRLDGDRLLVAGGSGFQVVDIADPSRPRVIGEYEPGGGTLAVWADADDAIAVGSRNATIIDISRPVSAERGSIPLESAPVSVELFGETVAILMEPTSRRDTLVIASVADIDNPVELARLDLERDATTVTSTGSVLFVGVSELNPEGGPGVLVIDVTDPAAPAVIAGLEPADGVFPDGETGPALITAIHAWGTRLAVAVGTPQIWATGGVVLYDISEPLQPVRTGHLFSAGDYPISIAAYGDVLYTARWWSAMRILGVDDRGRPSLLAERPLPAGTTAQFDRAGDTLAVALGSSGIRIYDVSVPADPVESAAVTYPIRLDSVRLAGDRMHAGINSASLGVFDITDRTAPELIARQPTGFDTRVLGASGDLAFTSSQSGLSLYDLSACPCNADLVTPPGVLDLADIVAFVTAFIAGESAADIDGNSVFDTADIHLFIAAFGAGCP